MLLLITAIAGGRGMAIADSPPPTWQASPLAHLQQHTIVSGEFRQQRQLTGLPRALESSGRFVFWRGHGLYWETLLPFYQATTFTVGDVIHWTSENGPPLDAGPEDPVQNYVSKVMLSLFSADPGALDRFFASQWRSVDDDWSLQLEPAHEGVARVIKTIRLEGDQYLRRLSVTSANGDRNVLMLEQISAPIAISPAQCRRFSRANDKACDFERGQQ